MTISRISRAIVALSSLLFAGVALALWLTPAAAAQRFGLEAAGAAGTATLRADLGGLFAGMAILSALAAWTMRQAWSYANAAILTAIVFGRAMGWIGNQAIGGDALDLVIELVIIAALLGLARRAVPTNPIPSRRRQHPVMIAGAVLLIPAVGGLAVLSVPSVQQKIFDFGARQKSGTVNRAPLEDDALRVAICGSSAPLPSERRAKACVAVFAGGKFYIVDAGPESVENLVLWGIPLSSIGGVMLTHFHSDHIGDLGELNLQTWAGGRPGPLPVYGGPGVEEVVNGFDRAYQLDQGYRTAHHTARVMPPSTWPMVPHTIQLDGAETPAKDRTAVVLDDGTLRVTAFEVDHTPIAPAYGYRFDYKGRSVLITGDTKFHKPIIAAARGADVLVSEAIALSMTRALGEGAAGGGRDSVASIMHDIENYHITPEQAAEIANDANVKLLVFYHLLPSPDGLLARRLFAQGIDSVRRGGWAISEDGSLYTLPLGSSEVRMSRMLD
jgi:ribonuclease Z